MVSAVGSGCAMQFCMPVNFITKIQIKILVQMDLWCCASALEVEKECDKDANEIIFSLFTQIEIKFNCFTLPYFTCHMLLCSCFQSCVGIDQVLSITATHLLLASHNFTSIFLHFSDKIYRHSAPRMLSCYWLIKLHSASTANS